MIFGVKVLVVPIMYSERPFMHVACTCTENIIRTTEVLAELQQERLCCKVSLQTLRCKYDKVIKAVLFDNENLSSFCCM
jgi:hypothetical protein